MDEHDEDAHGEHDHGKVEFVGTEVGPEVLAQLREAHPDLARNLELAARYEALGPAEREDLVATQRKVEGHPAWLPGHHVAGDRCAACGKPMDVLFTDRFSAGELPFSSFVGNVPVHARQACVGAFAKAHPRLSPQTVDRLRRQYAAPTERATPAMALFFRHDVLTHPPFELEDWADSVAGANASLDRQTRNDITRLLRFVHHRLFHS